LKRIADDSGKPKQYLVWIWSRRFVGASRPASGASQPVAV